MRTSRSSTAYLTRTLTAYKISRDDKEASQLVPDLATDTGTADNGGKALEVHAARRHQVGGRHARHLRGRQVRRLPHLRHDVIIDGPTYASQYLDIPEDKDGNSVYKGPYDTKGNDTAAYDKAVVLRRQDDHLPPAKPIGDFNYTVTLRLRAGAQGRRHR